MQLSLKNLSIRTQVLLPVLFTTVALFIALWVTKNNLEAEQDRINDNIDSLVFYKDTLAKLTTKYTHFALVQCMPFTMRLAVMRFLVN